MITSAPLIVSPSATEKPPEVKPLDTRERTPKRGPQERRTSRQKERREHRDEGENPQVPGPDSAQGASSPEGTGGPGGLKQGSLIDILI